METRPDLLTDPVWSAVVFNNKIVIIPILV